jgi:prevent-host-death family protein
MIKTIQASELRNSFKSALSHVKKSKKPLIITERGIATSVLVSIDEYEDYLNTQDPEFVKSIKLARTQKKADKVYSFTDVFGAID